MESFKQSYQQFIDYFMAKPASQRFAMGMITAAIVAAFGFMIYRGTAGGYVPASLGKSFSSEEMQSAREILRTKGMTTFREENGKLMVPGAEVDRYNAALLEGGGLPDGWAGELQNQRDKVGWFPSARQSKAGEKIALAKELRRILRALPDVADGSVVWASSEPTRFGRTSPRVKATVNVKPKPGREVSMRLVKSLRVAVANMVPGLKPSGVTVLDLATAQSHSLDENDPRGGWRTELIRYHTQSVVDRIKKQLSYIPGVLVTVDVKLENIDRKIKKGRKLNPKGTVIINERNRSRKDERTNQPLDTEPGVKPNVPDSLSGKSNNMEKHNVVEKDSETTTAPSWEEVYEQYAPAMVEATQVSIAIPEDYFTKVAEKAKAAAEVAGANAQPPPNRQTMIEGITKAVANGIGLKVEDNKVDVQTFVRVDADVPELESSWLDSAGTAANQWGGAFVLGLFSVWALWMVRKNMPAVPQVEANPIVADFNEPETEAPKESLEPAEPTRRDMLQTSVRDNPEMAAAIINQWLKPAIVD